MTNLKNYIFTIHVLFLFSCIKGRVGPTFSNSIEESKKTGIYSHSFKVLPQINNDTIDVCIKEAWCEKVFFESNIDENNKVNGEPDKGYQIVIKMCDYYVTV